VSRKLTIVQVTNRIPYPLNDGGNLATYHVADQLRKMGHKVVLVSLNTNKHYQNPDTLKDIFPRLYTTSIDTSLSLGGLVKGLFQKTPYNIARFYSLSFATLLQEVVEKEKPDLIQLEGIYLAIYANTIRSSTKVPIFLRSHNVEYEIWERNAHHEKNIVKRWYLSNLSSKIKKFEQTQLHSFDAIVAITERDAEFYKKNNYR
jgi:polysaccharide biosynthesis protein PslH